MIFLDKLFIGAYTYFQQKGRKDARFAASASIFGVQFLTIFMPLLCLKTIMQYHFLFTLPKGNKILLAAFGISWAYIIYFIYSKQKIQTLLFVYEEMTFKSKRIWNNMHLLILIFWCIFMFGIVYLNKYIQHR